MNPTSEASRVGVLGGTFDPVHRGHLAVAEACLAGLGLDRVLLVPSNIPPHREPPVAPAADRLEMVRLAVHGHDGLEASDVEVRRGGTSYTVDTLRELAAAAPASALFLLLGWDAARELDTWRDPEAVGRLATVVVFNRSGYDRVGRSVESLPAGSAGPGHPGLPAGAMVLEVPSPEVSATRVRAALGAALAAPREVPDEVLAYIRAHHLYETHEA